MCSQLMKYGSICDEECLAIGPYTLSEWSLQDCILLSIITIVMVVLMTIIYKKKSYAYRMELQESKDDCCGQCSAIFWYGEYHSVIFTLETNRSNSTPYR